MCVYNECHHLLLTCIVNSHSKLSTVAFKVYDVNGDGLINLSDMYVILRLMVGSNMSDEKINKLARQIIVDADVLDKDNSISFAEFKKAMANTNISNILTFNIDLSQ